MTKQHTIGDALDAFFKKTGFDPDFNSKPEFLIHEMAHAIGIGAASGSLAEEGFTVAYEIAWLNGVYANRDTTQGRPFSMNDLEIGVSIRKDAGRLEIFKAMHDRANQMLAELNPENPHLRSNVMGRGNEMLPLIMLENPRVFRFIPTDDEKRIQDELNARAATDPEMMRQRRMMTSERYTTPSDTMWHLINGVAMDSLLKEKTGKQLRDYDVSELKNIPLEYLGLQLVDGKLSDMPALVKRRKALLGPQFTKKHPRRPKLSAGPPPRAPKR